MDVWVILSAGLTLAVIMMALGTALVIYQRRFLGLHRDYADRLLRAQEEERAAVAREVHDDALQRVLLLMQDVEDRAAIAPPPPSMRFAALRKDLEDLSTVLRQMAYRLHPTFHREEGIAGMLERVAAEAERGGITVEVRDRLSGTRVLDSERSIAAYRIAQEALRNVARHARSGWALVDVGEDDGAVEITVEDYGAGFDPLAPRPRSLGLTSMAERARAVGGELTVDSHPGGGTRVRLRLPLDGSG